MKKHIDAVLLLNPFFYKRRCLNIGIDPVVVRHAGQGIKTGLTYPLGLAYMAATVLKEGYKVKLLDPIGLRTNLNEIYSAAQWADVIVIAYNVIYDCAFKRFRNDFKKKYFVFVGAQAISMSEELLNDDYCDVVIAEEPELAIVELLNRYPDISNVRGIIYKDGKRIIKTQHRIMLEDLDRIPFPARALLDPRKYWEVAFWGQPTAWILPSRGCPYNCIFCTKIQGRPRFRSAKNIVDEIESVIYDFEIRNFSFFDDNFNQSEKFVLSVCSEILKRKINIHWNCSARADLITKNMAQMMKDAGCVEIKIGLESVNDIILEYLHKDTTVERIKKGLEVLKNVGLSYSLQCIFGTPLDNEETVKNTLDFVKIYRPLFVSYNILTPLPGSELFNQLKDKITKEEMKSFNIIHTDYPLGKYSTKELLDILKKAYLQYYISVSYFMRILEVIRKRPSLIFQILKILIKQSIYLYNSIIRIRR